jgi:L-ascorbate metabolism protein UlaG (beta-lactamase superfamily)
MFGLDHTKRPRDAASVGVRIWSRLDGIEVKIADTGVIITAWCSMKKIRDRMESTGALIDDAPILVHGHRLHTEVNTVVDTENQEIANIIVPEVEVARRTAVTRTATPVDDTFAYLRSSLSHWHLITRWCTIFIDIL